MTVDHNILQFGIVRLPLASGRASSLDDEPKSMLAVVRIFFKSALVEPMCMESTFKMDTKSFFLSLVLLLIVEGVAGETVSFWHITDVHVDPYYVVGANVSSLTLFFLSFSVIIILMLYEVERVCYVEGDNQGDLAKTLRYSTQ